MTDYNNRLIPFFPFERNLKKAACYVRNRVLTSISVRHKKHHPILSSLVSINAWMKKELLCFQDGRYLPGRYHSSRRILFLSFLSCLVFFRCIQRLPMSTRSIIHAASYSKRIHYNFCWDVEHLNGQLAHAIFNVLKNLPCLANRVPNFKN